jgi:hypothetical protein
MIASSPLKTIILMKTIRLNLVFSILLASIFLFSCSSIKQPKEGSSDDSAVSYFYKTFRITSSKPLQGTDTTYFYVAYPEFSDVQINEYVRNHLVLDSGKSSLEEMGTEFISAYDKFYDEVEYKRPWYQEKKDSVKIETGSYIGFSTHFESYMGGAHGNYYILFNNYDIKKNKEISLNDVINKSKFTELTDICEKIFRKQEGISETHSLTDGYFFDQGVFSLPDNFILQNDGILFLYNIYEIKPYVAGDTRLLVPYSSIQNLLTTEGKQIVGEIKKHKI